MSRPNPFSAILRVFVATAAHYAATSAACRRILMGRQVSRATARPLVLVAAESAVREAPTRSVIRWAFAILVVIASVAPTSTSFAQQLNSYIGFTEYLGSFSGCHGSNQTRTDNQCVEEFGSWADGRLWHAQACSNFGDLRAIASLDQGNGVRTNSFASGYFLDNVTVTAQGVSGEARVRVTFAIAGTGSGLYSASAAVWVAEPETSALSITGSEMRILSRQVTLGVPFPIGARLNATAGNCSNPPSGSGDVDDSVRIVGFEVLALNGTPLPGVTAVGSSGTVYSGCPVITLQPSSVSLCAGESANFTINASPVWDVLAYQWRSAGLPITDGPTGSGSTISGATTFTLAITNAQASDASAYDCVVTNPCGDATSNPAGLTVNTPPAITTQPSSLTRCVGTGATFTTSASGSPTPTFQWRKNAGNIFGATDSAYNIASVTPGDAGSYTCIATNICGYAMTSPPATLTIKTPPVITTQPVSLTRCVGQSATFTVAAAGSTPLTYQWRKGGLEIAGATGGSYAITSVSGYDPGAYDCVVTNTCGTATSTDATLDVYCTCSGPFSQIGGLDDNFAPPNEPTSPRPALAQAAINYFGIQLDQLSNFDDIPGPGGGNNSKRVLAHSFQGLPSDALAGTLRIHIRAGGSGGQGPTDDRIYLGFADNTGNGGIPSFWWREIRVLPGIPASGWQPGTDSTQILDLALLPGAVNLLPQINSQGFLDLIVEDKTGVDFATLSLIRQPSGFVPWVTTQPNGVQALAGGTVTFTVVGNAGASPFAYGWRKDSSPITDGPTGTGSAVSGATTATLMITNISAADAASYDCVLAGHECGATATNPALLTVCLCHADFNCDGFIDPLDYNGFINAFESGNMSADFNHDGFLDPLDYNGFINAFEAGC